jgi:hypothetical protein
MSQFTAVGNFLIWGPIRSAHNTALQQSLLLPTTMTGHKPGSHKKRKPTRLQVSAEKRRLKKARPEVTPEATTAPPVVSQTQDDTVPAIAVSPTNQLVLAPASAYASVSPVGSPTVDNNAIAEMTAGPRNDVEQNDDNTTDKHTRMVLFNDKNGKHKTIKLTATSVFTFLRQRFVKTLSDDLLAARRTASSSAASVRKARSYFDTINYHKQVKVLPGKSRRIAEKQQRNVLGALLSPDVPYEKDTPIFDVKKASAVIPDVDWSEFSPSFNLDSRKLRRYVVEDVMFGDPKARERLLILISMHHDTFDSTWLRIYKLQSISRSFKGSRLQ